MGTYFWSLSGGFLWDDDSHVTNNPVIVGPLGLKEIWTTPAANYFPLVLTNFWVQHALWGLNPLGYHLVTLAFHTGVALLLWRVLAALQVPGAWLGAALWALHPVQVESVAWISELKNTQSGVCFLLSVGAYVRWLSSEGTATRQYGVALAAALLALLSKPSTVMLPVVLWLIQTWLQRRWRWRDGFALLPFFGLAAIAAGWTIWEQRTHSGALGEEWRMGMAERLTIGVRAWWFYVGKLAWPFPLSFIYPRGEPGQVTVAVVASAAAIAVLAVASERARRLSFRWWLAPAFFAALLFPVLGLFDVYFFRYSHVSDHFQYLASMGPLALAGAALDSFRRQPGIALAVIGACGVLAWSHSRTFATNETLWRSTLARNPTTSVAWLNLGAELSRQQRHPEAIASFAHLAALRPDDPETQNDVGWALNRAGYFTEAIPCLQRAAQLAPNLASVQNNLGNAYRRIGRFNEALAHYARRVELQPESAEALSNLGSALAEVGRTGEAIPILEKAVRIEPRFVPARNNLGTALGLVERWVEARDVLNETVRIDPKQSETRAKLAVAFAKTGKREESLVHFRAALRLTPESEEVRRNFVAVLQALGRRPETEELLTRSGAGISPR